MTPDAWQRYLRWNAAISETVFTGDQAGAPVYLDMDDGVLARIASCLSTPPDGAAAELAKAVRATLLIEVGHGDVFRLHRQRLTAWRHSTKHSGDQGFAFDPPPTIALLSVFTLAAEAMGSDDSHAANAYYPRLATILNVPSTKSRERLRIAYHHAAEPLWRSLNDWLALADGRYGVPTAHALTHRYIGLPLSQALVRAVDRRHLIQMFHQFGLPPGSNLPPSDMVQILDSWIQQNPSPASKNLQALWRRSGTRERIAEVVTAELSSWDDAADERAPGLPGKRAGDVRLIARLRRFPKASLQLSFLASMPMDTPPDEIKILSAENTPLVDVQPFTAGGVGPRRAADVDAKSMVEGILALTDPRTGFEATRHPRRIVAFRQDEQISAFVERERVQLGEDFLVLVKDEGALPEQVARLLGEVARPGYQTYRVMKGLPEGWVAFAEVQVVAAPAMEPKHADLNTLVPVISSQLNITGGLRLPGNLRKWSSLCPPEIRAVSQLDHDLVLTMTRTQLECDDTTGTTTWQSDEGVLLVDLAEQDLGDGDYELELRSGHRAIQRAELRMRSSDSPDRWSWESAPFLAYDLLTPLGALTATTTDATAHSRVSGTLSPHVNRGLADSYEVGRIWWSPTARPRHDAMPIVIESPAPNSCVVTGAHRIQLPPAIGRPTTRMVSGTCTRCGLVKRYRTWLPTKERGILDRRVAELDQPAPLAADVEEVRTRHITRDDAFDALVHLGGGRETSLKRVAGQVDHLEIPIHSLNTDLETLGHLEIQRTQQNETLAWKMAPPQLTGVADGTYFLSGAWSEAMRGALETAVNEAGGTVSYSNERGPTTWFVEELTVERLECLVADLDLGHLHPGRAKPQVVPHAAMRMVTALPRLSLVGRALHRSPLLGAQHIERFNVASASWDAVRTAASPGAYRFRSAARSSYYFRSEADVDQHKVAAGSASLVKHLEALRMERPLLGYYRDARRLAVPLGAALPGLYGRAAVLNSGLLPGISRKSRAHVYHDVPEEFASRLASLLSS